MSDKTLAYLASPYTKLNLTSAWSGAAEIAGRLLRSGLCVFSPIVHGHAISIHCPQIDRLNHKFWMPICEAFMERCDTLIVAHMEGWQESKGIAHEVEFFERARKPIFDLPDISTVNMVRRSPTMTGVASARTRCAELDRQIASATEWGEWGARLTALSEERRSLQIFLSYADGPLPPLNYREGDP